MNSEEKFIKYGKTLSGLIHNLNTPLMGVSGRIELMQMKFGEDKNVIQISTQLDRINSMLTAIAFLLDKEISNKDSGFDLKILLENYFSYLTTDMKFKHKLEKKIDLISHSINTNGCDTINYLHCVLNTLLGYVENDASISISNQIEGNKAVLDICLDLKVLPTKDLNINDILNKRMYDELKNKYSFKAAIEDTIISVKIVFKGNE